MRIFFLFTAVLLLLSCQGKKENQPIELQEISLNTDVSIDEKRWLSEWGFFDGPLKDHLPASNVFPYELNTPLFTDYAHKKRFVRIPEGGNINFNPKEVLGFPVGTVLIKTFYYPSDFKNPNQDLNILETRLLVNEDQGWKALGYIWNEEQTDAELQLAGASIPVSWKHENGSAESISYSVPNQVQCKSCHEKSGKITPIGPSARQLNRDYSYYGENQLSAWFKNGLLEGLPALNSVDAVPMWGDIDADLASRARAWLDVNCGHCHRPEGPAKNSGLHLTYYTDDPFRLGVNKPPVAAGRGSGGLQFSIVPGDPESSILLHRIESLDPGVMMPELGRKLRHEEGINLVREWIASLNN